MATDDFVKRMREFGKEFENLQEEYNAKTHEVSQRRADFIREYLDAGYTQTELADALSTKQPRIAYMLRKGNQ